jgi:bifunctional UDP-N-acetylglucosamine pyrophosphorylase/glucosamine-1-phosphate N-acetyltransferase
MLTGATLDHNTRIGPCAHLRPGTHLKTGSRVGNFVEVKNTILEAGAHADHLTYLGDSHVGIDAAIGAGTITCNYNGFEKFKTHIGAGAFVGSNTTLVAPVTVGDGALVAAGSVVTHDVGADDLAFARAKQVTRSGYGKKFRERAKSSREKPSS